MKSKFYIQNQMENAQIDYDIFVFVFLETIYQTKNNKLISKLCNKHKQSSMFQQIINNINKSKSSLINF